MGLLVGAALTIIIPEYVVRPATELTVGVYRPCMKQSQTMNMLRKLSELVCFAGSPSCYCTYHY